MYTADFRFLSSAQNSQIFLAQYIPTKTHANGRAVILIPPFAEELNRSKRMYVLCARLLASQGVHVVCFDFVGTGDSYGDWGSYCVADWKTNLLDVYQFVREAGFTDISFLAVRFGALLAADTLVSEKLAIDKCIFWDPIEDGEVFMRQLMRMKMAAAMAEESKKITTKELQAEIDQQGYLEIGGYHIDHAMVDDVNRLKLSGTIESVISSSALHWMTLGRVNRANSADNIPTCVPQNLSEKLTIHTIIDTKFWMQQEVTIAPALLRATSKLFANVN